jgi:hypothetical protein
MPHSPIQLFSVTVDELDCDVLVVDCVGVLAEVEVVGTHAYW